MVTELLIISVQKYAVNNDAELKELINFFLANSRYIHI